jgi:antitoxin component of MazEF toxin-antitoxin module
MSEDRVIHFVSQVSKTGNRWYVNIPESIKKAPYKLKPGATVEVSLYVVQPLSLADMSIEELEAQLEKAKTAKSMVEQAEAQILKELEAKKGEKTK